MAGQPPEFDTCEIVQAPFVVEPDNLGFDVESLEPLSLGLWNVFGNEAERAACALEVFGEPIENRAEIDPLLLVIDPEALARVCQPATYIVFQLEVEPLFAVGLSAERRAGGRGADDRSMDTGVVQWPKNLVFDGVE
jgi:hypothetical protein